MSSSTAQKRLRHYISILAFITAVLSAFYYIYAASYFSTSFYLVWGDVVIIVAPILTFIIYVYSIRSNQTHVNKFFRALFILAIVGVWMYVHISVIVYIVDRGSSFVCIGDITPLCPTHRSNEVLSILCACLVLIEVGLTLKYGPLPDNTFSIDAANMTYITPMVQPQQQFQQPIQQHYVTPNDYVTPGAYYQQQQPQQQPFPLMNQQPVGYTPKYEVQDNMYQVLQGQQTQQQQPYQQQQQPHPYSSQNYSAPQPRVPGTMVTAAPQPGGSPIMPYPSPGHSVAVSPVLPPGGYSPVPSSH